MKKYLSILIFFCCSLPSWAQFELKTSPLTILYPDEFITASAEYGFNESWGLDADLYLLPKGEILAGNLAIKHYFNPNLGIDRFHIGLFAGNTFDGLGVGFLLGYKFVSTRNIIMEFGGGIGRNSEDYPAVYGKVHVGYRFNSSPSAE